MTVDDLKSRLKAKSIDLLLDVRGPDEFDGGHVPGARNAPLAELNSDYVNNRDLKDYKEKRVAVICGIGKRSAQATVRLSKVHSTAECSTHLELTFPGFGFHRCHQCGLGN